MAKPPPLKLRDFDFGVTSRLRAVAVHPVVDGVAAGWCTAMATQSDGKTQVGLVVAGSAAWMVGIVSHLHLRSRAVAAENRVVNERQRRSLGL